MPVLAIDTATETLSIALGEGGEVLGEASVAAGRSHLELLLPAIDELLASRRLSLEDLDALVAGIGPGTFSGLRVGVATARGLAQGLGLPLAGSGSLPALACGLAAESGSEGKLLLPVIDARRGQVFAQLFMAVGEGKAEPRSEIKCLSPEELVADARRRAVGVKILAGGDGVEVYRDQFTDGGVETPAPGAAAHRIQARYHLAESIPGRFDLEQVTAVVPLYVRDPDADKTILLRKREPWLR